MLIGILLTVLGILSIFAAAKRKSLNNKVSCVIGIMLFIIGTLVCVFDFKGYIDLRNRVFVISEGLVFLGYDLFKVYIKRGGRKNDTRNTIFINGNGFNFCNNKRFIYE